MSRSTTVVWALIGFALGFGLLFGVLVGLSSLTGTIWIVPALVVVVGALMGLLPSLKDPASRIAPILAYGSAAALLFLASSTQPVPDSTADRIVGITRPTFWIAGALGIIGLLALASKSATWRWLIAALATGLLVVYFSGSVGGTGGGSWERWVADFLGVGLDTAGVIVVIIRKAIHFIYYGVLAWLAFKAGRADKAASAVVFGICFAIAHGAFDEMRQVLTPDRTGQFQDVLLDAAGAAFFLWLATRKVKTSPVKSREA